MKLAWRLRSIYPPLFLAFFVFSLVRADLGLYIASVAFFIVSIVESFLGIFDIIKNMFVILGSFLSGIVYVISNDVVIKALCVFNLLVVMIVFERINR